MGILEHFLGFEFLKEVNQIWSVEEEGSNEIQKIVRWSFAKW